MLRKPSEDDRPLRTQTPQFHKDLFRMMAAAIPGSKFTEK